MKVQAEICLYGVQTKGFDYLAVTSGPRGEARFTPNGMCQSLRFDSCSEALWAALDDFRSAGHLTGPKALIAVYSPGGERVAYVTAEDLAGTSYGRLTFEAAPSITVKIG